ncbi:MAG: zinc ribbon domain-containing protein [Methanomicrobiales archaeon]
MVHAGEYDRETGPEQYLQPGEKLLRHSSSVGIKKFFFNAYITDRRIFLVDQNEKKPGFLSKEIPRDIVMGSHLESPGSPDPFLVLTIRTSEDETRTMKIAFIQEGNDRTAEIEEWISVLHGRPLRPVKSVMRHREATVTVHKDDQHRTRSHEKQGPRYHVMQESDVTGIQGSRTPEKAWSDKPDDTPVAEPPVIEDVIHSTGRTTVLDSIEIAFCHHCGKRAPQGANFCPFCGTKLHRPGNTTGHT